MSQPSERARITHGEGLRTIDLFCGAGGMSLGFSEAFGHLFFPVWANDFNDYAAATYNANFGNYCVPGDIIDLLSDPKTIIPQADVVIGGPPCQGFSLLNKNKQADPRKHLWRQYFEIVERSGAQVFVMENVPQLLGSPEFEEITDAAEDMGFKLATAVLCAADYGVPQTRYRAFVLGCKFADPATVFPPKRTHFKPRNGNGQRMLFNVSGDFTADAQVWRSVRDAIGDLPKPEGHEIRDEAPPFDLHFGRRPTEKSILRYKAIPQEGMNRFDLQHLAPGLTPACWVRKTKGGTDLFGRLWWDRPAFTIRTEFFKPEKGRYLHPSQHRPITHREAARLQSFPDAFRFCGSKIEIAKQIGNAVPPLLAAQIAGCVQRLLEMRSQKEDGRQVHARRTKPHYVPREGHGYAA
ncbi:MAG TPA: DNA cytosine methyltransferase [Blastocatellia bacterium]|nr:DNA cytosine methyltransferase [Blastocatellia bacterium]HMV83492.1 DNA cytosine methyltransferase [Blastocatellia bacterium]HMX28834.1 DNA cytosine methyltransferase [Blastocatellia bacterium]HMY72734.1 DNA cytosine methyltransferase [Blastocatellia bacterium]HNG30874.1 DNA cytosine methyltransferase [Blastocatellia bacterium]